MLCISITKLHAHCTGPRGPGSHGRTPSRRQRLAALPACQLPMRRRRGAALARADRHAARLIGRPISAEFLTKTPRPQHGTPGRSFAAAAHSMHCAVHRRRQSPSSGMGAQPVPGRDALRPFPGRPRLFQSTQRRGTGSDEPVRAPMSEVQSRHRQRCAKAPASRSRPRATILTMRTALRGRDLFACLLDRLRR